MTELSTIAALENGMRECVVSEFRVGQRYLSETETELGLGMITQAEGRHLTVMFPATGEVRLYSAQDAPLARYQLQVQQQGKHADGWSFTIQELTESQGIVTYHGLRDDNQESVVVPETQLSHQVDSNPALTRLLAGQADRLDMYQLRCEAGEHLAHHQASEVAGLLGVRTHLLPHQLYIAKTVADRYHPRVLLADEVGLGKTIEAGMIIKRRLTTGRSQRALIVVPESLMHQWLVELRRRFALNFTLFDDERCEQAEADSENPFLTEQHIIISSRFMHESRWNEALLDAEFDLLIIDEAHHLQPDAPEFSAIKDLCEAVPSLLLLTATPEQEGAEGHFQRLQLLDPDRFSDFASFQQEQAHYKELAEQAESVTDPAELDDLLDKHGTGRVMFRNRRADIGGFPERHFHPVELDECEPDEDMPWWMEDPRIDWLLEHIKQNRSEKALLICKTAEQVLDLSEALRVLAGVHAATFHEGMTLTERDRSAAFFASEEDGSPILLCSEIGSEGRNFQFVHQLILFDLPANPDLLEQRIGRLDRIGQQQDIDIYLPYCRGSAEAILLPWYEQGMNAFTQCNAIGRKLYDAFGAEIEQAITEQQPLSSELLEQTKELHKTWLEHNREGQDKLQALNACRPETAEKIIEQIHSDSDTDTLADFMIAFFDRFGVNNEVLDEERWFIRPGEHMRVGSLPGLPDDGITITFDRVTALNLEDTDFLSWDHPMVQAALELLTADDFGSTCVAELKNPAIPAGSWFLELDFASIVPAPKAAALQEFCPLQSLRLLFNGQGQELSAKVSRELLDQQSNFIDKKTARQVLRQLRDAAQKLIQSGQQQARKWQQEQLEQVRQEATAALQHERQRLLDLQKKNPSVRSSEIEAINWREEQITAALESPQLSLQAVRILVNNH
ncbi:RNA polymerase-associated protein RapA [Idiomarina sp. ST10R2A5]|uniref:RNA polymerase-associated protein RapA n=1 Tax=Idiomarina sp. ST10R2A5 TaxID=3418368 RepID=UPI003EC7AC99